MITVSNLLIEMGDRLKDERKSYDFSQVDLAQRTGVHRNTLIRYETGVNDMSASFLASLDYLGFDIRYIVTGKISGQGRGALIKGLQDIGRIIRRLEADDALDN